MFSSLVKSARSLFVPPEQEEIASTKSPRTRTRSSARIAQRSSPARGMVTTRRQSRGLTDSATSTPVKSPRKRQTATAAAAAAPLPSTPQTTRKRRRLEPENADEDDASPAVFKTPATSKKSAQRMFGSAEPESAIKNKQSKKESSDEEGDESAEEDVTRDSTAHEEEGDEEEADEEESSDETEATPSASKSSKSASKVASALKSAKEASSTSNDAPKPKSHVRFDSEEPVLPTADAAGVHEAEEKNVDDEEEDEEDEDSDDDAPEAVTVSSGRAQAQAQALEAAKAAKSQEDLKRKKRQERDTFLKKQAEASQKPKKRKVEADPEASSDDEMEDQPVGLSSKTGVPALLPEEILMAEPTVRPPTPEPEDERPAAAPAAVKRHKYFDDEKPIKDKRRGDVNVRVLDKANGRLAPKVSKSSRNVRETWLAGRRGRAGAGGVERRKPGGGFVRR